MVTRVGESSAVTGRELSRCQLQVGFARVPWEWWEGKSGPSERTSRDEQQWWREDEIDGHVLHAPLAQRLRSIVSVSH
jgi:hypothetical protein